MSNNEATSTAFKFSIAVQLSMMVETETSTTNHVMKKAQGIKPKNLNEALKPITPKCMHMQMKTLCTSSAQTVKIIIPLIAEKLV